MRLNEALNIDASVFLTEERFEAFFEKIARSLTAKYVPSLHPSLVVYHRIHDQLHNTGPRERF